MNPHPHLQKIPTCSSNGRDCYEGYDKVDFSDCLADCEGLYADIDHFNESVSETSNDKGFLDTMIETYELYKRSQIESFTIVHDEKGLKTAPKPYQPLRVVQIYFDTATYDAIVKDVSVTLADQLGAIGGTMGLFAGFSFLSALEIIYYVVKYLISLVNRKINV